MLHTRCYLEIAYIGSLALGKEPGWHGNHNDEAMQQRNSKHKANRIDICRSVDAAQDSVTADQHLSFTCMWLGTVCKVSRYVYTYHAGMSYSAAAIIQKLTPLAPSHVCIFTIVAAIARD